MAKKSSGKKKSSNATAPANARPSHWPESWNGRPVIGETSDGNFWITQGTDGVNHEPK